MASEELRSIIVTDGNDEVSLQATMREQNDLMRSLISSITSNGPSWSRTATASSDLQDDQSMEQSTSQAGLSDNEDDRISVHANENDIDGNRNLDDAFNHVDEDASEDEGIDEGTEFADLLESIEEERGEALPSHFADIMQKCWGKALLTQPQKDFLKGILVPRNAEFMVTPRLNPEIYAKLKDGVTSKDKAAQRRQTLTSKAAIPVMQALASLADIQGDLRRKSKKNSDLNSIVSKLDLVPPMIRATLKVLNHSFSESLRKRKGDVCYALGKKARPYAHETEYGEYLFSEATVKKMKKDIRSPYKRSNNYSSKNGKSFRKSLGGSYQSQGQKRKQQYSSSSSSTSTNSNSKKPKSAQQE